MNNNEEELVITNLSDCIGPAFYDLYWDIEEGKHTYYDLEGGRGSLKSSFISVDIVLGIMKDPLANALCYRKVGDTLRDSVFEQIVWAIDKLGVSDKWKCTVSPMRCIYKPTGQVILFKGLDKAKKSKSVKVAKGYFKYLWFEELDEFDGEDEIKTVQRSVIRGGTKFVVFKSFNPPKTKANWANQATQKDKLKKDAYVSHTTYLDAPKDWLGQQFIDDAEWEKEINPKGYAHEYLGEPVGDGAEVFDNIIAREITDEEIARFDHIYMGVDWGWYPDPYHFGKMHYDADSQILYIFYEYRVNKQTNQQTGQYLLDNGIVRPGVDIVTCDSSEHKSTADYRALGINARDAEKGPDSVRYGVKWLQGRVAIVIDPVRCPKTYDEFSKMTYDIDRKTGEVLSTIPDENNHSTDMVRYAMERVWKRKGK